MEDKIKNMLTNSIEDAFQASVGELFTVFLTAICMDDSEAAYNLAEIKARVGMEKALKTYDGCMKLVRVVGLPEGE